MTPEESAAIEAVDRLKGSVDSFRDDIRTLQRYGHRNRWLIRILGILVVVVAVLATFAITASNKATEATSIANRNRQTQITTCHASNEARAANVKLWDYVLELASRNNPSPTPDQVKRIDDFKAYVRSVFAQRDCNAVTQSTLPKPSPTRPTR